ncbi:MAG: hypothetical protein QOF36_2617 [Microbacteriaceae bacterium]|jgi:hypothetical protein|nr:hypothetical protein [Microbacteriaceae bacterium]
MARKRLPKGAVAVTPGGNITMDHILGWAATYTIPDRPIEGTKLLRMWAGHDLDTDLVPQARNAVHVFQRACRSVETRRMNGRITEIKVDELSETSRDCTYQITRLIRDLEHRVIDHPKALRVTFDKADETIAVEALESEHAAALAGEGIEDAIRDYYAKNSSRVPGQKVRNAVRGQLHRLGASNLRGKAGGLYFVPKGDKQQKVLDSITTVLEELYDGDAELWSIAIANGDLERERVEKHFTQHVQGAAEEMVAKVAAVLDRNPSYIRKDLLRNVIQERKALEEQIAKYADMLGTKLKRASEATHIVDQQIDALVQRADELAAEDAA